MKILLRKKLWQKHSEFDHFCMYIIYFYFYRLLYIILYCVIIRSFIPNIQKTSTNIKKNKNVKIARNNSNFYDMFLLYHAKKPRCSLQSSTRTNLVLQNSRDTRATSNWKIPCTGQTPPGDFICDSFAIQPDIVQKNKCMPRFWKTVAISTL